MPAKTRKKVKEQVPPTSKSAPRIASRLGNSAKPVAEVGPEAHVAWKPWYSGALLSVLVLAALLPVSNRAFHIDDTLFVFAGKHIAQDPLNPYGFQVNWDNLDEPFFQVTKNPPFVCYYIAAVGRIAGWSEAPLHLAFLLPALGFVLLTFYLARRFTKAPLVAALATLVSPAYLVSSASVMCDTTMVALWLLAILTWLVGLDRQSPWLLTFSALLMGTAALTKYFGVSLIPLLLAYTLYRERRLTRSLAYFLIPVTMLAGYQMWTKSLYGEGLLISAVDFANEQKEKVSFAAETIEGLSFVGGCMFPVAAFAPWLWSKRQVAVVLIPAVGATALVVTGVLGGSEGLSAAVQAFRAHAVLFSLELTLFVAAGIGALALAVSDFWKRRDANSLFLMLWVLGTFVFASYFNWTVNARSVLPLLPAVGILIARRLRLRSAAGATISQLQLALALLLSGVLAVWVMIGDTQMANYARAAVYRANDLVAAQQDARATTQAHQAKLWFVGHWGMQFYGEKVGAHAADRNLTGIQVGDYLLTAENNTAFRLAALTALVPPQKLDFPGPSGAITINRAVAAGFYSSYWGPLPFFLGPVSPERYTLYHLVPAVARQ